MTVTTVMVVHALSGSYLSFASAVVTAVEENPETVVAVAVANLNKCQYLWGGAFGSHPNLLLRYLC